MLVSQCGDMRTDGSLWVTVTNLGQEAHTGENVLECKLDIASIEGRSLNEGEVVFA